MQRIAAAVLASTDRTSALRTARLLDAGCGTGTNLPWAAELTAARPLHAVDLMHGAVTAAAQALPHQQVASATASATALPYRDRSFDLVLSMDVLQHLTRDQAAEALREVHRVLVDGGLALVRTNAAFGRGRVTQREDWRLYNPASLRGAVEGAGLQVVKLTSANVLPSVWSSLPRPVRRRRQAPAQSHHSSTTVGHEHSQTSSETGHHGLGIPRSAGPVRNAVLLGLLNAEAALLRSTGVSLPVGHSLLLLCQRPEGSKP